MIRKSDVTYEMQRAVGWVCFHCGEAFATVGSARDHFGGDPSREPGCMIRVQLGDERGLEMALRKAEDEVTRLRSDIDNETSSSQAFYARLESEIKAFRPFRQCRSLQDVFNVYDSMEGRALAAEERLEPSPVGG